VKTFCRAKNPQILPVRKSRPRTKRLFEQHAFVVRQGKILLEQSTARWRGMWILPRLQTTLANQQPIYRSIFPFTNHRVALNVYAQRAPKKVAANQRWFDSIDVVAMPSPHRRAARELLITLPAQSNGGASPKARLR
jgi:hypothetical protein